MIKIGSGHLSSIATGTCAIGLNGATLEIEEFPEELVIRVSCIAGWHEYPDYQRGILRIVKDSEEVVSSDSVSSGE